MHKILILRGIQGSGKSYFAKKWVSEDPEKRIRVNRDDIRNMFGKYWLDDKTAQHDREYIVSGAVDSILQNGMAYGFDIVVDQMNLSQRATASINALVAVHNSAFDADAPEYYVVEYKTFNTPLEVCIERDSHRERPIGETVIRATYERYKEVLNSVPEHET